MSKFLLFLRRKTKKHLVNKYKVYLRTTINSVEDSGTGVIVRSLTDPKHRTYSASSIFGDALVGDVGK